MKVTYRNPDEISAAVGATASASVTYLRSSACESIRDLVREYRSGKAASESDSRLNPQAVMDDVAALRERIQSAINAAETDGKDRVERVRAAVARATAAPSDTQAQVLQELQIQQGYQRLQLHLAGGDDLLDVARSAGASGDRALIRAFRTYAGALTVGRSKSLADGLLRVLDQAETPFLSQTQLVCRDLAGELSVGVGNLGGCANQARAYVAGTAENGYLSAWQQGKAVQVAPEIPGVGGGLAWRWLDLRRALT
jgi:hypothetical protein